MAKVLLVDDHPDLREVVGELLRSHGHDVCFSHSGEDALQKLGSATPQAMIIDERLPGMSGIALLRKLRADSQFKRIPIILYSADDTHRNDALQAGANDFWLKSSDHFFEELSQLHARVAATPDETR